MKFRYMKLPAVIVMAAFLLVGCTSADTKDSGAAGEGVPESDIEDVLTAEPQTDETAGGDSSAEAVTKAADSGGNEITAAGTAPDGSGTPAANGSAGASIGSQETGVSVDSAAADMWIEEEGEGGDGWSGVYVSEKDRVTITLENADTISFIFGSSGIAGTAEVNGAEAVYCGDDQYILTFCIDEDYTLTVTVSGGEPGASADSPLNGTYILAVG